jgi:ADP-ribose pyrophosphatase YjhB (NUDIX family)
MKATIVYIIDPETNEVLMAKKVRKVGVGYWFGYGGKLEGDETPEDCTVRETFKESGKIIRLRQEDLEPVALMKFYNKTAQNPEIDEPSFEVLCYRVFMTKKDVGEPKTTGEMADPTWFPILHFPPEMKPGDELFVPQILLGTPIKGSVHFSDEKEVVWSSILPCKKEELTLSKAA